MYGECNGDFQGLSAHRADAYHQSTPLQELEVTGLTDRRLLPDPRGGPGQPLARGPELDVAR